MKNTAWWLKLAEQVHERGRETFLVMEAPVMVACAAVEGLRNAKRAGSLESFTPREAGMGLLYAGVRILALLGARRESILVVAGAFWDLSAPDETPPPAPPP